MKRRCNACGVLFDEDKMIETKGAYYCEYCFNHPAIWIPEKPLSAYRWQMDLSGEIQEQIINAAECDAYNEKMGRKSNIVIIH